MKAKYIIGKIQGVTGANIEGFAIFPEWCDHKETALQMRITEIKSAGFISIRADGGVYCSSGSISLGINSRVVDNEFIEKRLKGDK